jgi:hypothetical protein
VASCSAREPTAPLDAVEQGFDDQRFEIAALASHTVLRHVNDSGV